MAIPLYVHQGKEETCVSDCGSSGVAFPIISDNIEEVIEVHAGEEPTSWTSSVQSWDGKRRCCRPG